MDDATASLNDCGCCEGLAGARSRCSNDPGLPALALPRRHAAGLLRAHAAKPAARAAPTRTRRTRRARSRSSHAQQRRSDASRSSMPAACVADVLTFYQERIANEGFLRTATERRSVLELARAIGYELKPGVAASVHLAFTVEDAPGAPGVCTLAARHAGAERAAAGQAAAGLRDERRARRARRMERARPRQPRPADMAIIDVDGTAAAGASTQGSRPARPERQLPGRRPLDAAPGPRERGSVPARPGLADAGRCDRRRDRSQPRLLHRCRRPASRPATCCCSSASAATRSAKLILRVGRGRRPSRT